MRIISLAVLCGIFSLFFTGALQAGHADEPGHNSARLFASAQTAQALGALARDLPGMAGMDVLALAREDVAPLLEGFTGPGREAEGPGRAVRHFVAGLAQGERFPLARLSAGGEEAGLKARLFWAAYHGSPSGFPLPASRAGEAPACIIVLPSLSADDSSATGELAGLIFKMSGISGDRAENLPGDIDLWRHFIIAHEAMHCRHSFDDQREITALEFEREADQNGIDYILQRYGTHKGRVLAETVWGLRGVLALTGRSAFHATSAALLVPGQGAPATIEAKALINARQQVRKAVLDHARAGRGEGYVIPAHFYGAARALYDRGHFDDDPVQKRYVQAFLFGAARYFPSYFQITRRAL